MVHVEKIKESQNLEFKRSLAEIKEILQSISAFANKQGGKILVGIEEAKDGTVKEVVGIKIKGREIENLTNEIKQNTDPVIFPSIKIKKIESKEVLFMEVEENMFKPVFAKGSAFIRVGRTNRKLSSQEIRNMAKESSDYNFTELVCNEAQLKDIDEEKINIFVQKAKEERNFNLKYSSKKDFLKKMHLLSKESLRYSAILLYGKNPQEFVLQSEVRCGRFKGIKSLEFDDMEVIKGTLIEQADRIMSFIKRNLKVKATFAEGIERKEEWEYPLLALKEGVVNAVCHRDYALSANVQVRIFDDRLEIWSSGGLPFGLTVAKLKGKHESRPRNKEIANTFFMTKLIEQWGTGTNRMIELCKEHNLPEPLFEDTKSSFIITFRKYSIIQENLEGLNERQKKAVEFLLKHKKITNKQYHYLNSDITDKTVFRDLQDLVDKKIVLAKGEKKGRYYELLK
jgi:ATP-dependent DNA helicase RecG